MPLIYQIDTRGFRTSDTKEVTAEHWKRMQEHHQGKLMWKETTDNSPIIEKTELLQPNLESADTRKAKSKSQRNSRKIVK